jgi:signal peptidase I
MSVQHDRPDIFGSLVAEARAFLGWFAGVTLVGVTGWGFLALVFYLTRSMYLNPVMWVVLAAAVDLAWFLMIERNLWLSRLMRLRIRPGSKGWQSAFFFWLLGVPGILVRSTVPASEPLELDLTTDLNGQPARASRTARPAPKPRSEPPVVEDTGREVVETVVFVVVLVLLLKTFVAEAFVIPTGSMAETLLGYQKESTCPECGLSFPVNCSSEVDPQSGPPVPVIGCTCPNCRFKEIWQEVDARNQVLHTFREPPAWRSGDRVLVSKFPFDNGHFGAAGQPNRFDVIVFKYPMEPQKGPTPMNYIKRLCGLPGETIAIFNGDLYVLPPGILTYPEERDPNHPDQIRKHPRPADPKDLWEKEYTYFYDDDAVRLFHEGKFTILRKTPDLILAMRRLVYDNDHQAKDLVGKVKPRWQDRGGWPATDASAPKAFRHQADDDQQTHWLRYQHIIVERARPLGPQDDHRDEKPQLIRNYMGYNTGELAGGRPGHQVDTNWVGDLILECTANVEATQGDLTLELSKGADRFQARFDLKAGTVSLWRLTGGEAQEMAKPVSGISKAGSYSLRFANVDSRLTLWVDGRFPFQSSTDGEGRKEGGVDYAPWVPKQNDTSDPATDPNNLEPASIGAGRGAKVSVSHLQLWRDTYYTPRTETRSFATNELGTMYVQPGHYLCLGDNSTESSDGRYWGLVPERLLLGRALMVYYPFSRAGFIR